MSKKFLFSSAVLFIGGVLLTFVGLSGSDLFLILSIVLMLMGGIPLLYVWFKEFFQLLPEETDSTEK